MSECFSGVCLCARDPARAKRRKRSAFVHITQMAVTFSRVYQTLTKTCLFTQLLRWMKENGCQSWSLVKAAALLKTMKAKLKVKVTFCRLAVSMVMLHRINKMHGLVRSGFNHNFQMSKCHYCAGPLLYRIHLLYDRNIPRIRSLLQWDPLPQHVRPSTTTTMMSLTMGFRPSRVCVPIAHYKRMPPVYLTRFKRLTKKTIFCHRVTPSLGLVAAISIDQGMHEACVRCDIL